MFSSGGPIYAEKGGAQGARHLRKGPEPKPSLVEAQADFGLLTDSFLAFIGRQKAYGSRIGFSLNSWCIRKAFCGLLGGRPYSECFPMAS